MGLFNRKTPGEQEWMLMQRNEERFLKRQSNAESSVLNKRLEAVVPDKLQDTLDKGFYKAFELIFEKGTGVIEKTYNAGRQKNTYKVNAYTAELEESRKNIKAFSKQANNTRAKNLLVAGAEGVGLGILGIGLPDIPLFVALLLKSIYEIAMSYGYDYHSQREQLFILQVIQNAVESQKVSEEHNAAMNQYLEEGKFPTIEKQEQIKNTAAALSAEMLYMKFLQGIPIVGLVGGISDSVCLNKITRYAMLKYKRRFLLDKRRGHL